MEAAGNLPNYETFCASAERLMKDGDNRPFALAAIDIDFFKLFNEIHGRGAGDEVLEATARLLQDFAGNAGGIAGYFGSDDFALLIPWENTDPQVFYASLSMSDDKAYHDGFFPSVGIYPVTDPSESFDVMYDRARFALGSIRGSFTEHVAVYDAKAHEQLRKELRLLLDARRGLKNGEFIFYLQPKCDMNSGKIIGAEALVRWQSAERGMISPGEFIPVLERHNYIAVLDRSIWDAVAKWQRSLLDEGFEPLPVSVNVSRMDFRETDIAAHFLALTEKYNLPHHLLEIEITESAFVDSSLSINDSIRKLREAGFRVLIDDFGSGYSSLNSLRYLSFDILKTDIRFLDKGEQSRTGTDILESVHNMARLLNVPMIIEGVETADQVETLLSIGCNYAQGFFFHKPLPLDVYTQMIKNPYNIDRNPLTQGGEGQMKLNEFLDANMYSDETLNSILGAVAFVESDDDDIRLVRSNDRFDKLVDAEFSEEDGVAFFLDNMRHHASELKRMLHIAEMNLVSGCSDIISLENRDGDTIRFHVRVFLLNERDGRKLFYVSVEKIQPKWNDEDLWRELQDTQARLSFLRAALNRLPNPIFLKDGEARFLFFNDRYAKAFGMRRADYIGKTVLDLEYLPKDDRERFQKEDEELIRKESELSYESDFLFSDETSHRALYWSTGVHDKKTDRRGLIGEIVDISRHKKS